MLIHEKCVKLQKMPIVGNAHDDQPLFNLAHEIITSDDASYDQKIAALKRIDDAMGCVSEYSQAAIDQYISETIGSVTFDDGFTELLDDSDCNDI